MRRGRAILLTTAVAVAAVTLPAAPDTPALVFWNASPSVPIGLYAAHPIDRLALGDVVVVRPAGAVAAFIVARGYVGAGVPLLKHIAALPGQRICRDGLVIRIDGAPVAEARERDTLGRRLPVWQGCRTVGDGDVFLGTARAGDSLDGRYFGAVPASWIVGRAIPLWTDERGSGRFTWRAEERPPSFPAPQTRSIP